MELKLHKYLDLKERGCQQIPPSATSRYIIRENWMFLYMGLNREEDKKMNCYTSIALLAADAITFVQEIIFKDFPIDSQTDKKFLTLWYAFDYLHELRVATDRFPYTKDLNKFEELVKETHEYTARLLDEFCTDSWKELYYHNDDWEEMKKQYTPQ